MFNLNYIAPVLFCTFSLSLVMASSRGVKGDECDVCDLLVREKDLALQCEICEKWSHAKCININEDGFKVLQLDNIHWFCLACNKAVGKILINLNKVQKKQEEFDRHLSEAAAKVSKLENELNQFKHDIQSQNDSIRALEDTVKDLVNRPILNDINDFPAPKWSDIAAVEVDKKFETVSNELHIVKKPWLKLSVKLRKKETKKTVETISLYIMFLN